MKWDPSNPNICASGGWDNTIQIYDVRKKGPAASWYGPHVCGDAIDFRADGHTLLTGSYRQEDVLELWDLRKNKKFRNIDWDGPKVSENYAAQSENLENQMEGDEQKNDEEVDLDDKESSQDTKRTDNVSPVKEREPKEFTRQSPAPFIYATQFNNK